MGHIVVGVDGSNGSRKALDHALELARLRGASLRVVNVYPAPVFAETAGTTSTGSPVYSSQALEQHAAMREAVRQAHTAMVQSMVLHADPGDVEVEIEAVGDGHPVKVLVELAEGADGLVVGSRGRSRIAGMLLGSVSSGCVGKATCPVIVVPDDSD